MSKVRFILVGGFLGAGKTTTLARLAKAYRDQGQNVGIVTNDQATDLVGTHGLRSEGFDVGEVAGSCFCCNFNGLAAAVEQLEAQQRPDVILAEPVGSCTDVVATVVQPLRRLYQDKFAVAPYGVILKPSHGRTGHFYSPRTCWSSPPTVNAWSGDRHRSPAPHSGLKPGDAGLRLRRVRRPGTRAPRPSGSSRTAGRCRNRWRIGAAWGAS